MLIQNRLVKSQDLFFLIALFLRGYSMLKSHGPDADVLIILLDA